METKRKALGKGLEQLFSNERIDFENFENNVTDEVKTNNILDIPIDDIRTNPYQPRKIFDENALEELAQSIKEHGIVQPVIVKRSIKGYELVAGERRTKAAKIAGLKTIPSIIRDFNDEEMMEVALIENIQRENLNPIEEAMAYDSIIKANNITQEDMAKKFGKSRSYITNILGLLKLPKSTIKYVEENKLSMSHARALSKLDDPEEIERLAEKIIKENLNVRDIENLTRDINMPKKKTTTSFNNHFDIYQNMMQEVVGSKVKIKNHKIEIPFSSEEDLIRILETLNVKINEE